MVQTELPLLGKNVWKMKYFPGREKVWEVFFWFWSGKFRKNEKSHGISEFPPKKLFYSLLKNLISKNCKWFIVWNMTFIMIFVFGALFYMLILQSINTFGWMRMAIRSRQKVWKMVKSQEIEWQPCAKIHQGKKNWCHKYHIVIWNASLHLCYFTVIYKASSAGGGRGRKGGRRKRPPHTPPPPNTHTHYSLETQWASNNLNSVFN